MYIETNNSHINSILIGNINFLKENPSYISVPNTIIITEETYIDNNGLKNIKYVDGGVGYEITELTQEQSFELEKI